MLSDLIVIIAISGFISILVSLGVAFVMHRDDKFSKTKAIKEPLDTNIKGDMLVVDEEDNK